MAFWKRDHSGITDDQRLKVLELATDEDHALSEFAGRLGGDLVVARAVLRELAEKDMIELQVRRPKGGRESMPSAKALEVIDGEREWTRPASFENPYVVVAATDDGWRWHQRNWRSS